MSPIHFLGRLLRGSVRPDAGFGARPPKLDENYPDHINNWASTLKNSVEGIRDDSSDLQKKYENAPLRRRPKPKRKKKGQ